MCCKCVCVVNTWYLYMYPSHVPCTQKRGCWRGYIVIMYLQHRHYVFTTHTQLMTIHIQNLLWEMYSTCVYVVNVYVLYIRDIYICIHHVCHVHKKEGVDEDTYSDIMYLQHIHIYNIHRCWWGYIFRIYREMCMVHVYVL